jgi:hypothetical protein
VVGQQALVVVPKMSGRKNFADCGKRASAPPRGKIRDKVGMGTKATRMRISYLLELLDGTLVDTAALVDQMAYYVCEREVRRTDRGSLGALPVVVDLPESTWPITTTLMCIFSLLQRKEQSARSPLRSISTSP